jgi:LuxR family maltose regulon positive regulatory protein
MTLNRGPVSVRGLVVRERLLRVLDEGLKKSVTIISAPAGSGKTSFLRTWIDQAGDRRRIVLVSARSDEDEQEFWLSLLTGLQIVPPAPAPVFSGAAMVDRVLSELDTHREPTVLVVDDAHELGQDALANVARLLSVLPSHVRAILSTRYDLRLGTHKLRLVGELADIRAEDLAFTPSETRELFANSSINLTDRALQTLQERTEGWAAGLRLAALSLAVDPNPEKFVAQFSGSSRVVADYLLAEMLERQVPIVQRLLLTTSVLDRVNGELADLLSETSGSDKLLLELEDANAFVVSLDRGREWFRYHPLFRELLRLELRRTTPALVPKLHRLAADWFAQHGQVIDAIRHTQAIECWKPAAELLTDNLFDLVFTGRGETIQTLLQAFPEHIRANNPDLSLAHAQLELMQGRFSDAALHLDIAGRHAETLPPERQGAFKIAVDAIRLGLARRQGRLDEVVELVNHLASADVARCSSASTLNGVLRALVLTSLGNVLVHSGRLAEGEVHLRDGVQLARKIGQPYLEIICLAHLGFSSMIRSSSDGRLHLEEAIALAERSGWGSNAVVLPALVTLGATLIWVGEFAAGERWLQRAASITNPEVNPQVELFYHLAKGMLHASRSQLREALDEFEAAENAHSLIIGEHVLAAQATGWMIATKARLGMLVEARTSLRSAPAVRADAPELRNASAVISLISGDPAAVLAQLNDVLEERGVVRDSTLVETYLLAGQAYDALGRCREKNEATERALALAESNRLMFPFVMTGARELLEAQPRQSTAHAALLLDALDILNDATPRSARGPKPSADALSDTELRILRYLPTNLSRPDIARELDVSVNTVSTHIRNIYSKLDTSSRAEAVERARELRILALTSKP